MKNTKFIWLVVAVAVVLAIFLLRSKKQDAGTVYETVNFCGTEYQVEKILISGVDVIKRIAEIATEEQQKYCQTILNNKPPNTILETRLEHPFIIFNGQPFSINLATGKIFIEGFDSVFFGYLVK